MGIKHPLFDWIFTAIVGIPTILAVIQLAAPDWLEPLLRRAPADQASLDARDYSRPVEGIGQGER